MRLKYDLVGAQPALIRRCNAGAISMARLALK
jgi:hypothetical protein